EDVREEDVREEDVREEDVREEDVREEDVREEDVRVEDMWVEGVWLVVGGYGRNEVVVLVFEESGGWSFGRRRWRRLRSRERDVLDNVPSHMDRRIEKRIYKPTLTKRLTRNLAGVNQLPGTRTSRSRQGLAKPMNDDRLCTHLAASSEQGKQSGPFDRVKVDAKAIFRFTTPGLTMAIRRLWGSKEICATDMYPGSWYS
ncbi:MAG: hypothetical protein Q9188_006566, partial [Gyalolechia gomerana]